MTGSAKQSSSPGGLLQPTIATLVAFGGLSKDLVVRSGEYYRLLSAPFLHAGLAHIVMSAFALFIAGRIMERLIGRAWFVSDYGRFSPSPSAGITPKRRSKPRGRFAPR